MGTGGLTSESVLSGGGDRDRALCWSLKLTKLLYLSLKSAEITGTCHSMEGRVLLSAFHVKQPELRDRVAPQLC